MNSVIVYAVLPDSHDELVGFQVKGNDSLIVGLGNGEEYQSILKKHGVNLHADASNQVTLGDISEVKDVTALMTECRDFFRDMGFECGYVSTKSYSDWVKVMEDSEHDNDN